MLSVLAIESELVKEIDIGDSVNELMRKKARKRQFLKVGLPSACSTVATLIQMLIMDMSCSNVSHAYLFIYLKNFLHVLDCMARWSKLLALGNALHCGERGPA